MHRNESTKTFMIFRPIQVYAYFGRKCLFRPKWPVSAKWPMQRKACRYTIGWISAETKEPIFGQGQFSFEHYYRTNRSLFCPTNAWSAPGSLPTSPASSLTGWSIWRRDPSSESIFSGSSKRNGAKLSRVQPKAENFAFWYVSAKFGISAKRAFLQKWTILAEIAIFQSLSALFRQHFETYFGQKSQNASFGSFSCLSVPFGRNYQFPNPLFRFQPKPFRLNSK